LISRNVEVLAGIVANLLKAFGNFAKPLLTTLPVVYAAALTTTSYAGKAR
jgi:hypothetical protein